MAHITLSVPEDMKNIMDEFKIINWSAVARDAFKQKLADLMFLKAFKSKSKLSKKNALKLSENVKKSMWKRYKKEGW